jgi:pimeloyl-ACP methyl ester carboxylesterase
VWEPVLPQLCQRHEVIALDLPGFGASPMPANGTPAGVPTLVRLLCEFLDEQGLERPHVAGNSLGGWLAFELARHGRAATATGLSPAGFWTRAEAMFARVTLWASVRAARLVSPAADKLLAPLLVRRAAFAQLVAKPAQLPTADAADSIRALGAAPWFDDTLTAMTAEHYRGIGPLPVPATIAWGEHDRLLLPRQAARAARSIPGARSITLRGCGHVPTYDDPDQVAQVLLAGANHLGNTA